MSWKVRTGYAEQRSVSELGLYRVLDFTVRLQIDRCTTRVNAYRQLRNSNQFKTRSLTSLHPE